MSTLKQERLVGSDRPLYRYTFTVEGVGAFPTDMLRYDSCWPATSQDGVAIDSYMPPRNRRAVSLVSYSAPTPERWASFMWGIK